MRIGTCHFVSKTAADKYYKPYGYTACQKIAEGAIKIGKPTCNLNEKVIVNSEGRYEIISD
jgi:hypothetical protein